MTEEPYRLRTLAPDTDYKYIAGLIADGFGNESSDEEIELEGSVFEPTRNHVIEYEGAVVANAGAYTRDLTVPGAVVPAAHVTMVAVRPTHRRRGLLTRLMNHQLREIRQGQREPIAVLWASEGRIYPRFGYGLAAVHQGMTIDTREVRMTRTVTPEIGRVRDAVPEQVRKELQEIYERVRPHRPGWSERSETWWSRRLADPPSGRQGQTRLGALLFDGPAGPDGYALWRRKAAWEENGPKGEVHVYEVVAATPEAYVALWDLLLTVDLTRIVRYWVGATDEPLHHLVNEPRKLCFAGADTLWVRIVDLPAALSARRYAAAVDVVFEVTDGLLPDNAGRWRLRADQTQASCARTTDPPDLTGDITDLGAAYLGGTPLAALAAAGRVRELNAGALAIATTAFGWHRAPSALEVF